MADPESFFYQTEYRLTPYIQNGIAFVPAEDWKWGNSLFPADSLVYATLETLRSGKGNPVVIFDVAPDTPVENLCATQSGLLVKILHNVRHRLAFLRPNSNDTWESIPIQAPTDGTISLMSCEYDSEDVLFTYESFTTPTRIYHLQAHDLRVRQLIKLTGQL